jgi:hypothetical protein
VHEGRTFALTLAGGFVVLGLLALWKQRQLAATIIFALSAISLLAALFVPGRIGPLRSGWIKIGETMGIVTTPLLMAALYYLVVSPSGLLRRVLTRRSTHPSGWQPRPPLPPASRMERQF